MGTSRSRIRSVYMFRWIEEGLSDRRQCLMTWQASDAVVPSGLSHESQVSNAARLASVEDLSEV